MGTILAIHAQQAKPVVLGGQMAALGQIRAKSLALVHHWME
jgi:hypothetical protein